MMKRRDVVIIGGGPVGRIVVHELHAAGRDLSVTLIKDEEVNVNRCAIPYGIDGGKPIERFAIPNTLVTDFGAELVVDRVVEVDTRQAVVRTVGGEVFTYRDLVWATGARPLIPPIPGVAAANVLPVRSLKDLDQLRHYAAEGRKVVVVGGGYIGVEVAVALRKAGLDVSLVEMLPQILMTTSEPEFIQPIETTLVEEGLHLLTGRKVVAFKQHADRVQAVELDDGRRIETDFVVLSVGVMPNTELARESGLEVSRFGVVTDEHLRTHVEHVYAAGDCAEKKSFITGGATRGEFGTNATFMARVVARNMLGGGEAFPGVINTSASTAFQWATGSAGLTEHAAMEAGLHVVSGVAEIPDRYPMMDGVSTIHTKLVFEQDTRKLVGGSLLRQGTCLAAHVDFLSLAIQQGATIDDLVRYQYATHPELAAKPSHNHVVFACRDALKKFPG